MQKVPNLRQNHVQVKSKWVIETESMNVNLSWANQRFSELKNKRIMLYRFIRLFFSFLIVFSFFSVRVKITSHTFRLVSFLYSKISLFGDFIYWITKLNKASSFLFNYWSFQTLVGAWQNGALNSQYLSDWLDASIVHLRSIEDSASPPGWSCEWDRYYYLDCLIFVEGVR